MPAYLIVDTRLTDPEAYEEYKALARPVAEQYGGTYRVRGGAMEVIEAGLWTPSRLVVVEFPDMASARAFLDSPEYAPVKQIRHANAECTVVLVEGF
ncbi:DUF1330 domain-containing protein [Oceanicella sp. SM1341]|uniref:DUF1330 domain-containing protein n=1 Tax=Oceanicella sp. SM1341 TaxID=1548889 RepID=UPI000E4DA535|nr:DUF1330 domain-containing protein [Oceanicella sp. SM1341]